MIKLTIYGRLRKFIGQSTFEINAKSPKEAFSFLINNYTGVGDHIKEQEYCVMAGNIRITEDLLDMHTESDIKIIPVVHGEILPIIFGSLLTSLGAGSTILGLTIGSLVQPLFTVIGINMLSNGIQELFTPDSNPLNSDRQEDPQDPNYIFTGLLNNSKQGVPINIIYGETLVGSTVVSSSVDTFQVVNEA